MKNFIDQFELIQPSYERFARKINELIKELLEEQHVKFHGIEYRAKTIESFNEKVQRKGKSYLNPINDLTDLAGVRIILYYLDDINKLTEIIDSEFDVDEKNSVDKKSELQFDQFGYLSIHKVISLKSNRNELVEWQFCKGFKCEVQIRTVLQHAWASISHTLQYKEESDVPKEIRRELHRLSGLLELADEEFLKIKQKRLDLSNNIGESINNNNLDIRINLDSLFLFSQTSSIYKRIAEVGYESGYARITYGELERQLPKEDIEIAGFNFNISLLIKICEYLEIETLQQLEGELNKAFVEVGSKFTLLLSRLKESEEEEGSYFATPEFLVTQAVILMYLKTLPKDFLVEATQWDEKYISIMLSLNV